jgi:hypothetical protein
VKLISRLPSAAGLTFDRSWSITPSYLPSFRNFPLRHLSKFTLWPDRLHSHSHILLRSVIAPSLRLHPRSPPQISLIGRSQRQVRQWNNFSLTSHDSQERCSSSAWPCSWASSRWSPAQRSSQYVRIALLLRESPPR